MHQANKHLPAKNHAFKFLLLIAFVCFQTTAISQRILREQNELMTIHIDSKTIYTGLREDWYENGQKVFFTFWYKNGQIKKEGKYQKNGWEGGFWTEWYENCHSRLKP